jgi:hypothetical protein
MILVSGAVPESRSPCGNDCSYTVEFEGPTFNCSKTEHNETSEASSLSQFQYEHYSGGWNSYNTSYRTWETFNMNLTRILGHNEKILLQEVHLLHCQPALANYQVLLEYVNGSRTVAHNTTLGKRIQDTFVQATFPGFPYASNLNRSDWSDDEIRNLKSINQYGIMDTVVKALTGTYEQLIIDGKGPKIPYTLSNGTTLEFSPVESSFSYLSYPDYVNSSPGLAWGGNDLDVRKCLIYEPFRRHSRLTRSRAKQDLDKRHGFQHESLHLECWSVVCCHSRDSQRNHCERYNCSHALLLPSVSLEYHNYCYGHIVPQHLLILPSTKPHTSVRSIFGIHPTILDTRISVTPEEWCCCTKR